MEDEIKIDIPELEDKVVIKIIGVGGGGGNAVNHMFNQGIHNVDFMICNTDRQALAASPIQTKVLLGESGLGAGNKPEEGRKAAEESADKIKELLSDSTEMVFITAGMGGGTGTGAAPVIAEIAKSMGILTVAIVTIPFLFEGPKRLSQALRGVEEMRKHVDSILIINTEKLREIYPDTSLREGFGKADDILTTAAKGIAEMITIHGYVNCDLNDVRTTMRDSGDAVMGSAEASGTDRARIAIENALNSPLLLSTDLSGARNILLNISYSKDSSLSINELNDITTYILEKTGYSTEQLLWGDITDETLGDNVRVTIVATGFDRAVENSLNKEDLGRIGINLSERPAQQAASDIPDTFAFDPRTGAPNPNYKGNNAPATTPHADTKSQIDLDNIRRVYGLSDYSPSSVKQNVQMEPEPAPVMPETQTEIKKAHVVPIDLDGVNNDRLDSFDSRSALSRQRGATSANNRVVPDDELSPYTMSKKGETISISDKNSFINNRPD